MPKVPPTSARRARPACGRLAPAAVAVVLLVGCGGPSAVSSGSAGPTTTPPGAIGTAPEPSPAPRPTTSAPAPAPAETTTRSTTTVPPTPSVTAPATASAAVGGTVRFGPVCPVERIPPDPACAPRPGAAHVELLRGNAVVAAGDAGPDGRFSIPVAPGTYDVRATAATPGPGRGCGVDPGRVTVTARSSPEVAVSCDTGIR